MKNELMEETVYRQFAELEDYHFWFIGRRRIFFQLLEDHVFQGRKDLDILEVGCGAGGFLGQLSDYGKVTGLDIAHDWMTVCRQRGFDRLLTGSGYSLPLKDACLDVVGLFDTLEHIPDDVQVLREVRRVLRPGGRLFVSVPAYQWLFSQNDRVAHHIRRYTRGGLLAKMRDAGLVPLKSTYFNAFLFPLILPALLVKKAKELLFTVKEDQTTNLTHRFIPPVNAAFTAVFSAERPLLRRIDFPFGHSLIGIARRS